MKKILGKLVRTLLLAAMFGVPSGKIVFELSGVIGLSLFAAGIVSALAVQSRFLDVESNNQVDVTPTQN